MNQGCVTGGPGSSTEQQQVTSAPSLIGVGYDARSGGGGGGGGGGEALGDMRGIRQDLNLVLQDLRRQVNQESAPPEYGS